MEILTPSIGLILWQLLILVAVPLTIASWILIATSKVIETERKIMWLIITLFIPLIGAILFFVSYRKIRAGR